MLTIGDKLPDFNLTAVTSDSKPDQFDSVTQDSFANNWRVLFFWPKDFTFVCPTEIIAFDELNEEFKDRDAQLLGVSTDSDFVHLAWRNSREDLKKVSYPWLSDIKKELSESLGVLDKNEGVALRATFIVDPDGIIRFVSVNDLNVGRNPREVLRVLDALQTDELCPCNWEQGQETINV